MTRPPDLLYAAEEHPPPLTLITMGLQQLAPPLLFLVFAQVIASRAGVSFAEVTNLISMAALACAIGTLLMSIKASPLTGGQLLIVSASAVYIAPSIVAMRSGGLPLLFGMTIFSGALQTLLSPLIRRLKLLFSAEIGFLLIMLIGFELSAAALRDLLSSGAAGGSSISSILIAIGALALTYILRELLPGTLGKLAFLLAFLIAYLFCFLVGFVPESDLATLGEVAWFSIPKLPSTYAFSSDLILPFSVAAVVATLKVTGSVSAMQKMQDTNWERPNMKRVSGANAADGIATLIGGLLGAPGVNVSTTSVGISLSTRIAARSIGLVVSALLLFAVFCNKLTFLVIMTPEPVKAALLLFVGASLVSETLRGLGHLLARPANGITLVTSLLLGLSYSLYPKLYARLPESARLVTGSSIGISALCAFALTLLFHLTLRTTHRTVFFYRAEADAMRHMSEVLSHAQEHWKASPQSIESCRSALVKIATSLPFVEGESGKLLVDLQFDDIHLIAEVSRPGAPLAMPETFDASTLGAKELLIEKDETERLKLVFTSDS